METLKVGKLKLTWLNGGVTHLDGGAMFGVVPKSLWSKKYIVNERNQIQLRTDPILIQDGTHNILIESGIGNNRMPEKLKRNFGVLEESNIEDSLKELGLTTNDIHVVLMTHMHFDHACGLTKWNNNNELIPTFEQARIITSNIEWDEMRKPNVRSKNTYWKENWTYIEESVETFEKEIIITEEIKMIHTGGHSDGHSIIIIKSENESLIHLADLLPTHAHQNPLWVMAYDDYPIKSIQEKQYWLDHGMNENAWFSFYHDSEYRALKWNHEGEITHSVKRIL
jgi:glyoxylase-like metal-dependent hydrolase (beta-lactamase superfamily II)